MTASICPFSAWRCVQLHVRDECCRRATNCGNLALGCVAVLPFDEVEEHMEKACTKRVVECRLDCGLRFMYDKRSDHEVLCCAVLCCAVLCCAVLCCAVLCCAVLCCAVLCCAALCCAFTMAIMG